jgi:hypothetical protein
VHGVTRRRGKICLEEQHVMRWRWPAPEKTSTMVLTRAEEVAQIRTGGI